MRAVKTAILETDTGEIISEKITYGVNNGGGWVIQYRSASEELALSCDSAITFKVFHLLISLQENYGTSGVVCTKKFMQDKLGVSRKSIFSAVEWLIEHDFLVVTRKGGCSEYFFNPSKVTIGRDKDARLKHYRRVRRDMRIAAFCKKYNVTVPIPDNINLDDLIHILQINREMPAEDAIKLLVSPPPVSEELTSDDFVKVPSTLRNS